MGELWVFIFVPANQIGKSENVWVIKKYGLSEVWVMRASTVYVAKQNVPIFLHDMGYGESSAHILSSNFLLPRDSLDVGRYLLQTTSRMYRNFTTSCRVGNLCAEHLSRYFFGSTPVPDMERYLSKPECTDISPCRGGGARYEESSEHILSRNILLSSSLDVGRFLL